MLMTDLSLKICTADAIKPYVHSIARLCKEVFKEYPYLCDVDIAEEMEHISRYRFCEGSIAALLMSGTEVVGAATGMPLDQECKQLQQPFIARNLDPKQYFHFSEALLLKPFRRRGVGHHFYDVREEHARKLGYQFACLFVIDREKEDPHCPSDFFPLDDFWRRRGFVMQNEIKVIRKWKTLQAELEAEHVCSFWIKSL